MIVVAEKKVSHFVCEKQYRIKCVDNWISSITAQHIPNPANLSLFL